MLQIPAGVGGRLAPAGAGGGFPGDATGSGRREVP
jgi:hypothetical protein